MTAATLLIEFALWVCAFVGVPVAVGAWQTFRRVRADKLAGKF